MAEPRAEAGGAPTPATGAEVGGEAGELMLDIAEFSDRRDTMPRRRRIRWSELARTLSRHHERNEKDGVLWSPAAYEHGARRGNDGVQAVTALVFDLDHAEPPRGLLGGVEYVATTSYSHTPEDPHWRVVIPVTRPVTRDEWPEVWSRARFWLCPQADQACKDPARFYYWPACPTSAERLAEHHKGTLLDPDSLPPMPKDSKPEAVTERSARLLVERPVGETDPVAARLNRGRRAALRLIAREAVRARSA